MVSRACTLALLSIVALGAACGGSGSDDDSVAACPSGALSTQPGVVRTAEGDVGGVLAGDTYAWKGIPYAAPPVGALRFRAPAPPACHNAVLAATDFGPRCAQIDQATGMPVGDEDCLTLNVWAPRAAPTAPLPVMVWIHGGGNSIGSSSEPYYDGQALVERGDVVVVTLNYRLGQLGYLAHPLLDAGSAGGVSGNYGIQDQLAALAWVRENIAAFGGDPDVITIFGESAGARNTCSLVSSPLGAGLFHRAIMQSGGCTSALTRADLTASTDVILEQVSCNSAADPVACLRAVPALTLVNTLPPVVGSLSKASYGPHVDGRVFVVDPLTALAAGMHNHVPFMVGSNSDETGKDAPMVADEAAYEALVRASFPTLGNLILAQYPAAGYPTPRKAYVALTTDARFGCPARTIARSIRAGQTEPVYRYYFTRSPGPLGAVHGLDVLYVFGTVGFVRGYTPTAADTATIDAMIGYWTRFARTGDPNGGAQPAWPAYAAGSDHHVALDSPVTVGDGVRTAQCDFWDALL